MKRRKRDDSECIKLLIWDIIIDFDEIGYNYMGGFELDGILYEEMKEVIIGIYMKWFGFLLEFKLNDYWNLIIVVGSYLMEENIIESFG